MIDHSPGADLSTRHECVTELFAHAEPAQCRLSDAQVEFFHAQGYLMSVPLLTAPQVAVLREELDTFVDPEHPGSGLWYEYHSNESQDSTNVLFHALGAWRIGPACHDALWNPRFTRPASQLLGGAVRFWHDQLFCKPPRHGGAVAWHQDYSYWKRTGPMAHLTCWIALDDSTEENGCIHYIPQSHHWDLLPTTALAGDMAAIQRLLSQEQLALFQNPVAMELKAGHACFHHPKTLHGSFANRSDRPRRALVLNVVLDGVKSLSEDPLLEGTVPIPPGTPLGGQFFPLLYDPATD